MDIGARDVIASVVLVVGLLVLCLGPAHVGPMGALIALVGLAGCAISFVIHVSDHILQD